MDDKILVEKKENIAYVYFNSLETFNAFDMQTLKLFSDHITSLACDNEIKGIIISGKGKAFCPGADLKKVVDFPKGINAALYELISRFHQIIIEIRNMNKPVIAAINGIAAGGGFSLALACDFRIMAKNAMLKQGYTSNGLSIDGGGTFTLPRLVGVAKAMEIVAFDKNISAECALGYGLINKIVEDSQLVVEAEIMLKEVFKKSLNSFGWSKKLFNSSFNTPLEAQLEKEKDGLLSCVSHKEGIEGINAFIEKRKPNFS